MREDTRAHPEGNIPRGVIFSDFSPSGCAPIPPAWHHRSESQQRLRSGSSIPPCREQTPPEGTNNHRARGKQPWISRAGSGHSSQQSEHRSREDKGTNLWTNLTHQGAASEGRLTRWLHASKQRPHTERRITWDGKDIRYRGRNKIKPSKDHWIKRW